MRITRTYRQKLEAPAAQVFPLICPVYEAEWLPGFEYTMIHSTSGYAEVGCIFTTSRQGEPDSIWTITAHDGSRGRVEFLRVTPGLVVSHIAVQLEDASERRSTAELTYVFTALSSEGEHTIVSQFSEESFLAMVQRWESCLNEYLRAR